MGISKAKSYQLIRATGSRLKPGDTLEVGGRKVRINQQGTVRVDDAGMAKEIEAKYGPKSLNRGTANQLISAEVETYNQARHVDLVKRTHYFSVPELPWKRAKDNQHV